VGLIACFISRCKAHCADESRGTRWGMARKTKLSPSAEMLKSTLVCSTFTGELQTALQMTLQNKKESCCVTTQLSQYSNIKEMYMTAFRHKLIHNSTTQSKTSKTAASGGNVPHLRPIITSHTVCTDKMMYCTMHAAALQQFWIYYSFDDCWLGTHCKISVFEMSRPTEFQKL